MKNIENELEKGCELLERGKEVWVKMVKTFNITRNDMILVLSNSYKAVNYLCLKYLAVVQKENNVNRFIVVGSSEEDKTIIRYATAKILFYSVTNDELVAFKKINSVVKFTDRVIFCNPLDVSDKNIFKVLGYNNITLEEIVGLGILGLNKVPRIEKCDLVAEKPPIYEGQDVCIFDEKTLEARIQELIDKKIIDSLDQIVLFGANAYINRIKKSLAGYEIVAIVDNDKSKCGSNYFDIPIYGPEQFLGGGKKGYKIIIASSYYKEMKQQLENMGYVHERDFYIVETRKNAYDDKLDKIDEHIRDCRRGFEIYKQLCKTYLNTVFFYNQRATGNTYFIGRYLPKYLENNKIDNYVVFNTSVANHRICEIMGINSVVTHKEDMYLVWKFARLMRGNHNVYFRELCPYDNKSSFVNMRIYKGLNFNLIYKLVLYELERYEKCKVSISQESASMYLKKNLLREGKTILLAPHANTVHKLPVMYWERLAECLKNQGYDVCTNCGPMEDAVKGTKRVVIPYSMLLDFVEKCTCVIGIRSGLFDIISSTHTKMVILYPKNEEFLENVFDFQYYSLYKLGLRQDNLFEVGVELEENEWQLEEILQLVVDV